MVRLAHKSGSQSNGAQIQGCKASERGTPEALVDLFASNSRTLEWQHYSLLTGWFTLRYFLQSEEHVNKYNIGLAFSSEFNSSLKGLCEFVP